MIYGFDIGGTTIKGNFAFDANGIGDPVRVSTPARDFDAFVEALEALIAQAPQRPKGVAISITGVVDPETGRTICANIPAIDGLKLEERLADRLGAPVIVANDADCFALAEAELGAGRGRPIVFGAILGTGVGGGLVVDGALVNRGGGYAGEWGHGTILATRAGDPPRDIPHFACGCGRKGCVDTVGGARGLERLHAHLSGQSLSSEAILAAWAAEDAAAKETLGVYIELVSAPLALAVNVTGADVVPVGGGLSKDFALVAALDGAVRSRILRRMDRPLVVPAQCRTEPGFLGACLLGLRQFE
ncbi:ROK family protein [Pelagibacterium xiamenense]|uniref:ROK family protein n=1 Tax=Pelagibacterium xiamenense TaxID=2901140 RepID=UPI001E3B363F|nr:ROK family protein [Pelagibacterium xiamenense]MCD7058967.1 ROK family protein [Pelagibacterium xiamenense]